MGKFISSKGRGYRWASFMFIMVVIMAGMKFLFAFAHDDVGGYIAQSLMLFLGGIILLIIPAYIIGLLVDKFKKNTNIESDIQPKQFATRQTSDDFYAQVWDEINDKSMIPDKALWAKSYADAQGNESLAKANYIKLRVEKLSKEHEPDQGPELSVNSGETIQDEDEVKPRRNHLGWGITAIIIGSVLLWIWFEDNSPLPAYIIPFFLLGWGIYRINQYRISPKK